LVTDKKQLKRLARALHLLIERGRDSGGGLLASATQNKWADHQMLLPESRV
jgi:hypothetical protein